MGQWVNSARSRRVVRAAVGYTFDTLEPRRLMSASPTSPVQNVSFTVGSLVADTDRNLVYVADQTDNEILAVDTATGTTSATVATDASPGALAVSADGTHLLVSVPSYGEVESFTLPGLQFDHSISSGPYPFTSVAQSKSGEVYGQSENGLVELKNDGTYVQTLSYAFTPYPLLELSPDGNTLYALGTNTNGAEAVQLYDVSTPNAVLKSSIPTPTPDNFDFAVTSSKLFTAADFVDGLGVTNLGTNTSTTYTFSQGYQGQYAGSVAALAGSTSVFAASVDAPAEIEEFNQSTGALVNNYMVNATVPPQSLVITPNGRLMYAGTHSLGLIGGYSLNVSTTGQDGGSFTASGQVGIDQSGNGYISGGGYGVAGATVYDDINNNGVLDSNEPSTTTTAYAQGAYTLANLPGNAATLRVVPPAGYVSTAPGDGSQMAYAPGGYPSNQPVNFPLFQTMTLSGLFFNDTNGSGRRDVTETGASGVRLFEDVNHNQIYDAGEPTTLTDANGVYTLTGLYPVASPAAGNAPVIVAPVTGKLLEVGSDYIGAYSGLSTTFSGGIASSSYVSGAVFRTISSNGYTGGGAGHVVYVDLNNDGVLDNNEPSQVTDSNGNYSIGNLPNGSLTVRVQPLAGFTVTAGKPSSVAITVNTNSRYGAYFYLDATDPSTIGAIAGQAFNDTNSNGSYDFAELPVQGRTIYIDSNQNGVLDSGEPSTVTDSSGNYAFTGLTAGTYDVRQVLPRGYVNIGSDRSVTLQASTYGLYTYSGVNFGSQLYAGTITGTVYTDKNQDGQFDNAEVGVFNRSVYIDTNNNGILDAGDFSTTTDTAGNYTFTGVPVGRTILRQVLPSGVVASQPSAGYYSLVVPYNQTITANFGSYPATVNPSVGTVTGQINVDAYGDGSYLETGSGFAGWTVFADSNNNGILDGTEVSTTSAANGAYTLANVPVGSTTIRNLPATGWILTSGSASGVSLNVTPNGATANFKAFQLVTASGITYNDLNGNGLADAGEPVLANASVSIKVTPLSGSVYTTTVQSNGNGIYTLGNIPPGAVLLQPITPSGYVETGITGSNFENEVSGQTLKQNFFAVAKPIVHGFVFTDPNHTGVYAGSSTPGLTGWTVYADLNNNSKLDAGEPSDVTDYFGSYQFAVSPNASYTLRLVQQPGYVATSPSNDTGSVTVNGVGSYDSTNFGQVVSTASASVAGSVTGGPASETIYLDANNNSKLDSGELSTTTTNGAYSFSNVPAGAYIIRQVLPSGYSQTSPTNNTGLHVTVTNSSKLTGENFTDKAVVTTGSISGNIIGGPAGETVYLDANNNGVLDSGELSTTVTGAPAGYNFSFASVPAGSYTLRQVLPSGYTQTSPASNAGIAVTVTAGSSLTGKNFTDAATAVGGSISGTVTGGLAGETIYVDANNNSKLDSGELSTTTSSTGAYSFSNVPVGATIIRQVLPSGYTQTTPSGGLGIHVTVTKGGSLTNENFVDKAPVTTPTKLTGTTIGTAGSNKNGGNTIAKATDGSLSTFYDGVSANGNWVGLDLGSSKKISQIKFAPRSGYASRMTGGSFQVSTTADFSSGVTTLYTIGGTPASGSLTTVTLSSPVTARYVRYLSPTGSYGNISEFQVFG